MSLDFTHRRAVLLDNLASPHAREKTVPLNQIVLRSGFWKLRRDLFTDVSIPLLGAQAKDPSHGHVWQNFRVAAGLEEGSFVGEDWQDEWAYKWVEAASVAVSFSNNSLLAEQIEAWVEVIAQAQCEDGYLCTQTLRRKGLRYQSPHHHELYVMGHLLTAACVNYRFTGKTGLLNVAKKAALHVHTVLRNERDRLAHFPMNPSIIMGAVELYRCTGDQRHLWTAQTLVDMRGAYEASASRRRSEFETEAFRVSGHGDLNQDRVPLRESREIVGHSVFWSYLYAGAADIYMETGEQAIVEALLHLWEDLVSKKIYITGGCGALHRGFSFHSSGSWAGDLVHEAVGPPHYLPNASAYNETCSQIGAYFWAWRMLLITGECRFADLMEREMYNGFLSGVGLGGKDWFYTNPLARRHSQQLCTHDTVQRQPIGRERAICCPTNLLRTVVECPAHFFTRAAGTFSVHHYANATFSDDAFALEISTNYPWDGEVVIRCLQTNPASPVKLRLRIPDWVSAFTLRLNGRELPRLCSPGSYATLPESLHVGDRIHLSLPMRARYMTADPRVESARNLVAVLRGPIVYCLESPDLPPGVNIDDVVLPANPSFVAEPYPGLEDSWVLSGEAFVSHLSSDAKPTSAPKKLYLEVDDAGNPRSQPPSTIKLRLIPYYAWANRGPAEMLVWLPCREHFMNAAKAEGLPG